MTGPEPGVALPLDAIVGRDEELAHVAGLLDETRFVTITGLGGAGKTRLALEVARRWTAAPVVFVDLSAVRDPSLFAAVVADALGADAPAQVEPEQAVARRLTGAATLLVLDNLEQIPEVGGIVRGWLMAAPGLRVLLTSRLPLSVAGERVVVLQPLPCAGPAGGPSPAGELFLREARRSGALDGDAVDYPTVERIVGRLGGIPLAIELAAAHARVLSLRQIEARAVAVRGARAGAADPGGRPRLDVVPPAARGLWRVHPPRRRRGAVRRGAAR